MKNAERLFSHLSAFTAVRSLKARGSDCPPWHASSKSAVGAFGRLRKPAPAQRCISRSQRRRARNRLAASPRPPKHSLFSGRACGSAHGNSLRNFPDLQIVRRSRIIVGSFGVRRTIYCAANRFHILYSRSCMEKPGKIASPKGKLGVLTPGMGAVSTTFMAGVELVRKGKSQPIGSLTQLGTIRLGKRTDGRSPLIKKFAPLADLNDLVFGSWDIFKDDAYQAAEKAGVLNSEDLEKVKPFLKNIKPMKAAFDREYVKRLDGTYVKKAKNKYELALQLKDDIETFRKAKRVSR